MPELPEVEQVRRGLDAAIRDKGVAAVLLRRKDYVTAKNSGDLDSLVGCRCTRTFRHGKKLFCIFSGGQTLRFHLGMSGRLSASLADNPVALHTHFILRLADGIEIRMSDPRRFGGIAYYPTFAAATAAEITDHLGADALGIKPEHLARWLHLRSSVKVRLLSQREVAGVGNIYADEALWLANIHPLTPVNRIGAEQLGRLTAAIRRVLARSIRLGGTTLRDYRQVDEQPGRFAQMLCVYGRAGKPCKRCGNVLRGIRVAARATVFCPACQSRAGRKSPLPAAKRVAKAGGIR